MMRSYAKDHDFDQVYLSLENTHSTLCRICDSHDDKYKPLGLTVSESGKLSSLREGVQNIDGRLLYYD